MVRNIGSYDGNHPKQLLHKYLNVKNIQAAISSGLWCRTSGASPITGVTGSGGGFVTLWLSGIAGV